MDNKNNVIGILAYHNHYESQNLNLSGFFITGLMIIVADATQSGLIQEFLQSKRI